MLLFNRTNRIECRMDRFRLWNKPTSCIATMAGLMLALSPATVHAHTGTGETSGFLHGLTHPIHGIDHLLAILAVGLWSSQQKRSARLFWLLPATFVSFMVLGGLAGMGSIRLPAMETMIALSVFILGLFIAIAIQLPVTLSLLLTGLFAFYHGHAHGGEMPITATGISYMSGMVLTTCLLHLTGMGMAVAAARHKPMSPFNPILTMDWVRLSGSVICLCGVYFCLGSLDWWEICDCLKMRYPLG